VLYAYGNIANSRQNGTVHTFILISTLITVSHCHTIIIDAVIKVTGTFYCGRQKTDDSSVVLSALRKVQSLL